MDVIAAGGGLAGAAFALEAARGGARALIIERTPGPHHKVCGEFLSDRAQALLRYLGVDAAALGASSIARLCLSNGMKRACAPLPFEAVGVSRFLLDEALLEAADRAGAEIIRGASVERLESCGDHIEVKTTRGPFSCAAAALATGKHNVRGLARPDGHMVGFKMHLAPTGAARQALDGMVHLSAFFGGYLGACLVERGVLSIAWAIDANRLKSIGPGFKAQSDYFVRQSPLYAELTGGAEPLWEKPLAVSGQPYGFMRSEPIAPSIYPIGDQLAVIPSFSGDGTALALASGIAAAQAVLKGEPAPSFQRRMLARYRSQFRRAAALDWIIANRMLRSAGMASARLAPSAVTMLVSATRCVGIEDLIIPATHPPHAIRDA